jgi:hypothetical protein
MGSVGGKHQHNQNFIYSSLFFRHIGQDDRLLPCALFNYNMSGKIIRLSMNVAFKI